VEHVTGALAALEVGFVGGSARIRVGGEIPLWAAIFIRVFCAIYFACNLGAGAFLFTTAANFRAAGGFDEQYFAGEEVYFTWALRKLGRFTILPTPIVTSGRKLRMHSARKILAYVLHVTLRGSAIVKSREYLDLWYDGKREGLG
jgi:GT2 family glycosyltransferase